MFNLSLTSYILIAILLVAFTMYYNSNEHFAQKNKKIHMMKVRKPSKVSYKPPVVYKQQTNADFNSDRRHREKHYHYHHYYDYSYPNYWYEYLYPKNWLWSWWGYPSEYDPKFSVPYLNEQPPVNLGDNCHKKCIDRYENEVDTDEYYSKIDNCINEYCY